MDDDDDNCKAAGDRPYDGLTEDDVGDAIVDDVSIAIFALTAAGDRP